MSSIGASQGANQISPVNERLFHQSNLLGHWKGTWTKGNQPVEFNVVTIQGSTAQVEYKHNGHTERGTATVNGATVTFGAVTVGTRDGKNAALEFAYGAAKMSAILTKSSDPPVDQNKLVGTWSGVSRTNGKSATFQVLSISGRDAQVKFIVNGQTRQGVGTVFKNAVSFAGAQISSDDGLNGTIRFPLGHQTFAVPVTKQTSSSSSVNKLA